MSAHKIRVGVLFGGQSGEHEVSLISARAVLERLDRDKYEVVPIGITKQGRWLAGGDVMAALEAQADPQLLPGGPAGAPSHGDAALVAHPDAQFSLLDARGALDVIFPVLHGPMGEDGTIQGLLELAGLPYVGCGVLASSVGMDKAMMKAAFAAAGLPLLPWLLLGRRELHADESAAIERVEAALRYPVFVKPANMGSSVGITKATDRATLRAGLAEAASYDRRIVVEQGVDAREIEISVLGNDDVAASVPGEIVPSKDWYDYQAKYLGGESRMIIPAPIAPNLADQVREMAIGAFKAIDGAGLARIDFLLDRATDRLYLNEANTMPGFTPVSMYAKMWEASGLAYHALLDRLIALAFERRRER